jgi:hypothetical protein
VFAFYAVEELGESILHVPQRISRHGHDCATRRGGTRIAVGSHEPFIGNVTSNIRPHEQKSRSSTLPTGSPVAGAGNENSA